MSYRDELEAAQQRIADLENQVMELKEPVPVPPPVPVPVAAAGGMPARRRDGPDPEGAVLAGPPSPRRLGCALFGVPIGLLLVVGACVAGCPLAARGCGAVGGETDEALAALKRCPSAREELGSDLGWAAVGCANCESESGGDPLNGGCHGSASWQMPVSGSRGSGSYNFRFSTPPGGKQQFSGGSVALSSGGRLSIPATGSECTLSSP